MRDPFEHVFAGAIGARERDERATKVAWDGWYGALTAGPTTTGLVSRNVGWLAMLSVGAAAFWGFQGMNVPRTPSVSHECTAVPEMLLSWSG